MTPERALTSREGQVVPLRRPEQASDLERVRGEVYAAIKLARAKAVEDLIAATDFVLAGSASLTRLQIARARLLAADTALAVFFDNQQRREPT